MSKTTSERRAEIKAFFIAKIIYFVFNVRAIFSVIIYKNSISQRQAVSDSLATS